MVISGGEYVCSGCGATFSEQVPLDTVKAAGSNGEALSFHSPECRKLWETLNAATDIHDQGKVITARNLAPVLGRGETQVAESLFRLAGNGKLHRVDASTGADARPGEIEYTTP
jgi:hypothetical protein